ncbi:MAG: hypothetical protein JO099_22830, partial [Acidobacteriia bacterium]|nr:hypothetical protein [Terriglobia bacterium]
MSPAQLLAQLKRGNVPAVMLLLGPEAYGRRQLKQAMTERVPAEGMSEHDLTRTTLAEVL